MKLSRSKEVHGPKVFPMSLIEGQGDMGTVWEIK